MAACDRCGAHAEPGLYADLICRTCEHVPLCVGCYAAHQLEVAEEAEDAL